VLAPIAWRAAVVILAAAAPAHPASCLGRLAAEGASRPLALGMLAGVGVLACLTLGGARGFAVLAGSGAVAYGLARLAGREGGMNGDFCGCAVILTECLVLIAAVV
jgi:adenosylcobinamide-GDP ribazoletransferase